MKRSILITGTTSGIGKALADRYEARGDQVIGVGRKAEGAGLYCRADLSSPGAVDKIDAFLKEHRIESLDRVIHNAGVGFYGSVAGQGPESIDSLLAVNLETPIELTRRLYPRLKAARGRVVFVSSVAAALPCPRYGVYAATKAALGGFARALRVEWEGAVDVQTLFPGATDTGMHQKMGIPDGAMEIDKFQDVDDVALAMLESIERGGAERAIGLGNFALRTVGTLAGPILDPFVARGKDGGIESVAKVRKSVPHCVVTGAASGIGLETALSFARAGANVLGIDVDGRGIAAAIQAARDEDLQLEFITADLTSDAGIGRVLESIGERGPVSTLVHSAGISWVGPFVTGSIDEDRPVLRLNLRAPLQLTAGLLERELILREGTVVFVSSLSRFVGYPGAAVYAASKDGLASFSRSLRAGLHERANVLTVYPGPTRTPHARRYSPDNSNEQKRMPPEDVAEAIVAGVRARSSVVVPGWGNRLACAFGSLAPRLAERAMKRVIYDKLT